MQGRDSLAVVGGGFGGSRVVCRSGRWGVYLQEIESGKVWGEDVETFTEDMFQKARIVGGDEGAGVGG